MKNFLIVMISIVGMLIIWTSHVQANQPLWMEKMTGNLVEEARKNTHQVSVAELKKALDMDEDEDIILLDVRTPREYEAAHIPNAVNAPRGLLEFSIWSLIPDQNEQI